jgi:hypothetical protein
MDWPVEAAARVDKRFRATRVELMRNVPDVASARNEAACAPRVIAAARHGAIASRLLGRRRQTASMMQLPWRASAGLPSGASSTLVAAASINSKIVRCTFSRISTLKPQDSCEVTRDSMQHVGCQSRLNGHSLRTALSGL